MHKVTLTILTALAATLASTSLCASTFQLTKKDFYLYPDYCKAKMADSRSNRERSRADQLPIVSAQIAHWSRVTGEDWAHLDSFCVGLTWLSRAQDSTWLRQNKRDSKAAYAQAKQAIHAAFRNSRPDRPLWEIFALKYAEALHGAGEASAAMNLIAEVLERNPASVEGYVLGARLLKRDGEINDAITTLQQGLANTKQRGTLWYWLAYYYYELGDYRNAQAALVEAESAGMKMDRLKRKLPAGPGTGTGLSR